MSSKKYPLHGAYLKIARATKHLDDLEAALNTWFDEGKGYGSTVEDEPDGWQLFRHKTLKDLPLDFGVLVGDVAHNARSALDHLAWELVELNGGNPGRHTGFPIFTSHQKWKAQVEDPYFTPNKVKRRTSPLKGVSRDVYNDIEKLQPYHRKDGFSPERQRLAELAWTNNADKHRTLHVANGVLSDDEIQIVFKNPHQILGVEREVLVQPGQLLEDGLELIRVRVTWHPDADDKTDGEVVVPCGVVLWQKDGVVGYPALRGACNEVIDIIGSFDLAHFKGAGRPDP